MANIQYVKSGSTGSEADFKISANGTFDTGTLAPESETNIVTLAAYDSNGDIVTATVGTITISASPIDGQWMEDSSSGNSTVNLSEAGAEATYSMPLYQGPVSGIRALVAGVDFSTEVDHLKIRVWSQ